MALFEVLQLLEILLDYLWVAYLWHTFIMPSTKRNGIIGQFIYAAVITLIVVFATIAVSRAAARAKKAEEERDKGILGLGGRSKD